MVAILPLSKYLNGATVPLPFNLARMTFPTYLPSCIAGCATPGRPLSDTMSPIANTSGCPGSVQSGRTATRAARSVCAPVASASIFASGEACTPAAQILVRAAIRSRPSGPFTVMLSSDIAVAAVFTRTSTPIFVSRRWV